MHGTIAVTGASSGIGEACAAALAQSGYTVACISRRGTVPNVAQSKGELVGVSCDVSDEDQRTRAIAEVLRLGTRVVGLVNAAGFQRQTASADLPLDEFREILETNLVGALRMCQLLYEPLRDAGGLIVNVGSFYGKLGVPNFLAYSASKAALAAMTRTLGVEWARDGISVLDIAPGYVETGLNADFLSEPGNRERLARRVPVGRLASSDEIARLVVALFEADVRFLTAETIYVDGAQGVSL
jgi:NAD(P)-dependent dehydrogenase (short-subunit alcohol dehydrogenase family)